MNVAHKNIWLYLRGHNSRIKGLICQIKCQIYISSKFFSALHPSFSYYWDTEGWKATLHFIHISPVTMESERNETKSTCSWSETLFWIKAVFCDLFFINFKNMSLTLFAEVGCLGQSKELKDSEVNKTSTRPGGR